MLARAFAVLLLLAGPVFAAAPPLPAYLSLPAGTPPPPADQVAFETYGEAEVWLDPAAEPVLKRGKYWHAVLTIPGLPADADAPAIWARLKPALAKAGWAVVVDLDVSPTGATLSLRKPGLEAWIFVRIFSPDDIRLDLVEIAAPPFSIALKPPAATPEKIEAGKGDFPWLPPLPGAKFDTGAPDSAPMEAKLAGADQPEIVAPGSIQKHYIGPEGLSSLLFVTVYGEALRKAGWRIVNQSQGPHQTDGILLAHYTGNGRNIWAYLRAEFGAFTLRAGDAGARDMAAELNKTCHVALDGVLFDFNKSTLKPESAPVLERVRAMLAKDAALKVEVQGHTDSVGGDAYNLTLSDARARAVAAWLTAQGIAAERMGAKGYGKTMPVADNDSDLGRARNRRVEVAKPGCKPK